MMLSQYPISCVSETSQVMPPVRFGQSLYFLLQFKEFLKLVYYHTTTIPYILCSSKALKGTCTVCFKKFNKSATTVLPLLGNTNSNGTERSFEGIQQYFESTAKVLRKVPNGASEARNGTLKIPNDTSKVQCHVP